MKNPRILITAGPTREAIDPIRFISNRSTGEMGYELAAASIRKGCETLLISGPVNLSPPRGVRTVNVTTAREMEKEVREHVKDCDCLIMAAAVCDFRPGTEEAQKIKKKTNLEVTFVKNPDILMSIKGSKQVIKIGFALETENARDNAKDKMDQKELDMIVINTKGAEKDPFGRGAKDFVVMKKDGETNDFLGISKREMADIIISEAMGFLK